MVKRHFPESNQKERPPLDEQEYYVERIMNHMTTKELLEKYKSGELEHSIPSKIDPSCKILFLTKWQGYPMEQSTWEPSSSFRDGMMFRGYIERNKVDKSLLDKPANIVKPTLPAADSEKKTVTIQGFEFEYLTKTKHSKIFKAVDVAYKRVYAAKVYNSKHFYQQRLEGLELQRDLGHPNIARLFFFKEIDFRNTAFYELADKSLYKELDGGFALHDFALHKMCRSVLTALDFLHRIGIHRDIRPDNIVKKGEYYKVTDFSCFIKGLRSSVICGTKGYMAPELVPWRLSQGQYYTSKVDMYAFGKTMIEASTGAFITDGNYANEALETIDPRIASLIYSLVATDPKFRLSAELAFNHPWVKREVDKNWVTRQIIFKVDGDELPLLACYPNGESDAAVIERVRHLHGIHETAQMIIINAGEVDTRPHDTAMMTTGGRRPVFVNVEVDREVEIGANP